MDPRIATLDKFPGAFSFDIVGESYYQQELAEMCGGKCEGGHEKEVWALLVMQDDNPHDSHAVTVEMDTGIVGHLSRDDASRFRVAMQNMGMADCALKVPAKIVGGWIQANGDEGHFGVKLDLPITSRR
jgi:hypothetical protein